MGLKKIIDLDLLDRFLTKVKELIPTKTSDLTNDSGYMAGMTILSYGKSTWADFIEAYDDNKVVYCRASSNSNPATGSQTRMAFMAYVNNQTTPTNVEFQYYRSVNQHTDAQQGDQVYVYKLDKNSGWSVITRNSFSKVVAGTGLSSSYANSTITLTNTLSLPDDVVVYLYVNGSRIYSDNPTGSFTVSSDVPVINYLYLAYLSEGSESDGSSYTGPYLIYGEASSASYATTVNDLSERYSAISATREYHASPEEGFTITMTFQATSMKNGVPVLKRVVVSGEEGYSLDYATVSYSEIPVSSTSYESKAAVSGGTDVSLVTTGEKYIWNNKGTYSKPSGGIPDSDIASAATWNAKGNGTITGITMNGASKGTSGVVNLGTVITSHQDISGKADKSATVSNVAYDSTNKKITKTINGTTSDVVSAATLKTDMALSKSDVGLGNVDNVKQYSASNPPPYPVTSVNGSTGAVTVSVPSAGTASPKMDGTAAVGSSAKYAKEDHVHPSDTTKADKANTALLSGGTEIKSNDDLNTFKTVGNYYCRNSATAATLSNCPISTWFYMRVSLNDGVSTAWPCQEIINGTNGRRYYRYDNGGNGWTSWVEYAPSPSAATVAPKMDGTAAVGTSAKYAKEDHVHPSDTTRVAMTGDQTVAGNKTFSGTTSLTADSIYPSSTGTAISANAAAIIQSPIPKYLWHDVFAFCRDCTPTYYTTADGSTWTQSTLEKNLFIHKMTWGRQNVISDTVKGSRWIWDTGAWNYGSCAWLLIGFSYTARNAYFDILLEQSDSSGNWTTLLTKSNCYYSSVPVWFKTNGPQGGTQIRLTIIRNSSDTTTNALPVTSIRWLASRWGDQGRGEELEYPYQWDADNNILPVSNNTNSLGSSSYKWKNINVGQLNGTTIPDSPKFTDTTALGSMTGTLGVDHGGTGKTTANDAANVFMNALGTGSSTPVDADYYISQYVGGGTTTTTYHRRPMSALWEYIKGKISSVLGLTASSYGGSAAKVNNHTVAVDVPSNAKFTDTTYESKAAASGGTDVSLVTTGEKATWNAKTSNVGTITGIKMNGASKGTSGVVDLGTVITAHQDISGKADKSATVSNVAYDSTNKKITKTINGTTSDVVTAATLKSAMSLAKGDVGLGNVENKSSATIRGELTKANVTTALGYTPPTTDTTYSAGDGLIQNGTTFSDHRGIEYIRGTWTAASGTWTGVSTDTELYDGKQIILYMPFGGSGNATLNLTLAGGGTTGAKDVYFESTTRFTTHKGQNSQLHLIYHDAFTLSNGTTYQGWWYVNNRDTTNVSQLSRVYNSIKAKAAIYRYQILLTYNGEYLLPVSNGNNNTATNKTMTTEKFDPFGQIYYWSSTTTVSANSKLNDWNHCMSHYNNGLIDFRYAFNTGTTLTANKAVYLVCVTQTDGTAKLHTTPISQTLPTSADGYIYKYLGQAYDTYRITLDEDKPCYYYKNGCIRLWTNQIDTTYESKSAASGGTAVSLVTTGEKYTWNNKGNGTITGITMNGASKGTSGVIDLGTVITAHQSLTGKQDKLVSGTNIKTINGNSLLGSGNLTVSGLPAVTSSDNDKVLKVVNGAWAAAEGGGGGSSIPYTDAILHVKAPIGSSLTFTKDSTSERLGPEAAHPNADGVYGDWYYSVGSSNYGAWQITAALNNHYDTTTVSPSEARQYDVLLRYTMHLFDNGDQCTAITGGWKVLNSGSSSVTDSVIRWVADSAGNAGHRSIVTTNKINPNGRTILKVKFIPTYSYYATDANYRLEFGVSNNNTTNADLYLGIAHKIADYGQNDDGNVIIASADISDYKNTEIYIRLDLYRCAADVYEVWMEW